MVGGKVLFLLESPSVAATIITMFSYLVRLIGSLDTFFVFYILLLSFQNFAQCGPVPYLKA